MTSPYDAARAERQEQQARTLLLRLQDVGLSSFLDGEGTEESLRKALQEASVLEAAALLLERISERWQAPAAATTPENIASEAVVEENVMEITKHFQAPPELPLPAQTPVVSITEEAGGSVEEEVPVDPVADPDPAAGASSEGVPADPAADADPAVGTGEEPEPAVAPPPPQAPPAPPPLSPRADWLQRFPEAAPRPASSWSRPQGVESSLLNKSARPGQPPSTPRAPLNRPPPPAALPAPSYVQLRFPNGRAGERYEQKLEVQGPTIYLTEVLPPPELGMYVRGDSLLGTPPQAGDFRIKVRFSLQRGGPLFESELPFLVNPDPRSLWQNQPSNRQDPYWKADTDHRQVQFQDRRVVAASRRGRSHAHVGSFRDDDFEILTDPESGWMVVAVADGAGSSSCSREGSRLAVKNACASVLEAFAGETGKKVLAAAGSSNRMPDGVYQALGKAAQDAVRAIEAAVQPPQKVRDYATTLLLAALHPLPEGAWAIASFWCGDGAMGLYSDEPSVQLLGEVDSGEYAGQTRFLDRQIFASGTELYRRMRFVVVPRFTALILMTDGVSDPHFETEKSLEDPAKWKGFWAQMELLLQQPQPEEAILEWLNFWSAGNHDDRTLLLVW